MKHWNWQQEREDFRAGVIAATIGNVNRKKGKKAFKPTDFMPRSTRKERKRQNWKQQLGFVEALTQALGGKDLRKDKE